MRGGRLVGAGVTLGMLAGAPGAVAAGPDRPEGPPAYRTAPGAVAVRGAASSDDGPRLAPGGGPYTDTLAPGERKFYTVELDGRSSAYVSAVAAPAPGSAPGLRDGIEVSLRAEDGTRCGPGRHRTFLSVGGAYPLADYAERVVRAGGPCAGAGTYRFVVERGEAAGGDAAPVPVELAYVAEPPRDPVTAGGGAVTGGWSSQAPADAAGGGEAAEATEVEGGTGFNDAPEVRDGVWKDELRPGETRFYRVNVAQGRQLFADAQFGGAGGPVPYVVGGARLGLSNAARGFVMNRTAGYQSGRAAVSLATPPAAYAGGGAADAVRGMALPGWYFLQVSLSPKARPAGGVPVTLKVAVAEARPAEAPALGGSRPGPGAGGSARPEPGRTPDVRLLVIGYAGVGTGSALLVGLGAWMLARRRRAG
ncbi:hypothetical protein GCM10010218_48040 [Streptomyces mashuensis]|uniref:Uncharacterized protein n=1 Tax=Streptomyces mashuensis TaxID=33904 RepID=A0A919EE27_9ACTN|nr:hypothetical protein [Streptomyces mashuensis]GHF60914.1 hypothetical protein GCM10010218_48040 [Streptomyces mashuensis]